MQEFTMNIAITIRISESGDTEGKHPHSIVDHVEELDRAPDESDSHVDALDGALAQSDQTDELTFGTDVDDSEL